jgi:hypothetical protein
MLSIKLFPLLFCLFRFNRNIKTLCFGIEAKQPKQTVSKQTKQTETALNFLKKSKICSLSNCFCCSSVVSVQSRHRNSLFRYISETTETNVLFRIVPIGSSLCCCQSKLVSKDTLPASKTAMNNFVALSTLPVGNLYPVAFTTTRNSRLQQHEPLKKSPRNIAF